jgi:streptogramin lyase
MIERIRLAALLSVLAFVSTACASGNASLPSAESSSINGSMLRAGERGVRIREFRDLPRGYSDGYVPAAITTGPDNNQWVTDVIDQDYGENAVVAIAGTGKRRHTYHYRGLLSAGSDLNDIVSGPDGALWMPDTYNEQILRMTTEGTFTGYPLPKYVAPSSITVGPDKALWFTARQINTGVIGRITVKGHVTTYDVGNVTDDIAAGSDGALWFTEYGASQIGRITTRGKITEYSTGITSVPESIAPGPDGALWFTEPVAGRIGRITTHGTVTEYSRGISAMEQPQDLVAGSDNAIWFTEYATYGTYHITGSKIGRITMDGRISEYARGMDPNSGPTGITAGLDGNLWFVATFIDQTGRLGR